MSDNKRKHAGKQDGSRKRYKSDGTRVTSTTIAGPGVFITCIKGKERVAGREIREVFESIASDLWPKTSDQPSTDKPSGPTIDLSDDDDDGDDDLEARIRRDRDRIQSEQTTHDSGKAGSAKPRKRIVIHYTDTPCLLFASCAQPVDPIALTLAYLDEVKQKGAARTRTVQRLEPISATCVAALPELLLLSEKILTQAFETTGSSEPKRYTYKVIAKVRNNSKLSSQKLAEDIPQKVPTGHSVSLKQPELTILVVVFKSVAGIGVVPRYEELKRYNVAQLVEARDLDLDLGESSRLRKTALDDTPAKDDG